MQANIVERSEVPSVNKINAITQEKQSKNNRRDNRSNYTHKRKRPKTANNYLVGIVVVSTFTQSNALLKVNVVITATSSITSRAYAME